MTTFRQLSLAAGEITPALYARVDIVKYQTGLRTLRNMYVLKHGGSTNRPGTQFIAEVKDSSKFTRLIPFIFSTSQTYILEFGDLYMRVILNGAQVLETATTITGASQTDPCVITDVAHGYSNGDEVFISGVSGMVELNGRNFKVANVTANTFEITDLAGVDIDATGFTAYSSGGTAEKVFELTTTYLEADLPFLDFAQSADVVNIVHPTYPPRKLSRTGHAAWSIDDVVFAPVQETPGTVTPSGGSSGTYSWVVTAINDTNFEESLPSAASTPEKDFPTEASPVTLNWADVTGAGEYNVYRAGPNEIFGFIGVAANSDFEDIGFFQDYKDTPPSARNPFGSADNYPSCVNYIQQRIWYGGSNNSPETVYGSRVGFFENFSISRPLQDDDAVTFTLVGSQVSSIRWILDLGRMIVLTESGEWSIDGNAAGIVTPFEINARQNAYNGAVTGLKPLIVNNTALFVQARGSIVRDISFSFEEDIFKGNDLSIFSNHLFEDYTLNAWAYEKTPHSVVWAVRSDGTLLSLTYVREHSLFGWARHDFQGETVESVASIPEGNEDVVYLVIKRTINGNTVRYIEKMVSRLVVDIIDNVFLDSHLSYDGRNTDTTHTMTLSGGVSWDEGEVLTCTSSTAYFTTSFIGRSIFFNGTDADGEAVQIRCEIETFSSTTVVGVRPNKTVPASDPDFRNEAISDWDLAVQNLGNLHHLEGEDVGVWADRFVVASPNNPAYDTVTVSNGQVTLDDHYAVIHIGLPYISDIETLDIDRDEGETLLDRYKNISSVDLSVEETRGIWAGSKPPTDDDDDPLEGLYELKIRETEGYDESVDLATGTVSVNLESHWNSNGRIFLRQIDPVPMTILSIAPAGMVPIGRTR